MDVAIVGGGYTGLWTAWHLLNAQPSLRIAVLEAERIGFGASGRNGGWCTANAYGLHDLLASEETREAGLALQAALRNSVADVGAVCQSEGIDCGYRLGGNLRVARNPEQAKLLRAQVAQRRQWGSSEADVRWVGPAETTVGIPGQCGAVFDAHCAVVQPAQLVEGLLRAVRARGAMVREYCRVTRVTEQGVDWAGGSLKADRTVLALEGALDDVADLRRTTVPIYSILTATDPLPASLWDDIGLRNRETLADSNRVSFYAQRTVDDRLAFGSRGDYLFGSRRLRSIPSTSTAVESVRNLARSVLPALADVPVPFGWGGFLGARRRWRPGLVREPSGALSIAGYVGQGVAASHLAGRIGADLLLERSSDLTKLPWAHASQGRWPPEPFRWAGAQAMRAVALKADGLEDRRGRPESLWDAAWRPLRPR